MDLLKQRILNEGTVLPGNILKVDSFLNHQIDTHLAMEMGKEFAKVFSDCKIDRVLTIEASGIAIGFATALAIGVPLVFAKKTRSAVMNDLMYSTEVESFTKKKTNTVFVSKRFLPEGENVLIVDDFLATGAASLGLARLVNGGIYRCRYRHCGREIFPSRQTTFGRGRLSYRVACPYSFHRKFTNFF